MRLTSLLVLALAPAACASAQNAPGLTSLLGDTTTVRDSRTQTPAIKAPKSVKALDETQTADTLVFKLDKMTTLPANDVCLTMRVYQHSAANPKTLTGYSDCQKADRHGIKNATLVLSR